MSGFTVAQTHRRRVERVMHQSRSPRPLMHHSAVNLIMHIMSASKGSYSRHESKRTMRLSVVWSLTPIPERVPAEWVGRSRRKWVGGRGEMHRRGMRAKFTKSITRCSNTAKTRLYCLTSRAKGQRLRSMFAPLHWVAERGGRTEMESRPFFATCVCFTSPFAIYNSALSKHFASIYFIY